MITWLFDIHRLFLNSRCVSTFDYSAHDLANYEFITWQLASYIAVIVIYQETFEKAQEFIKEVRQAIPKIFIALVGNNTDMAGVRMVKCDVRHYIEHNAMNYCTLCKGGATVC